MKQIAIEAKKRETGKRSVNAIRKNGGVPCVVYGKDIESYCVSVDGLAFEKLLNAHGMNALFNLKTEDDSCVAMIADIQRDPVSRIIRHVDFHNVSLDEAVEVTVPVHIEGDSVGVRAGGILEQIMWEIDIEALPMNVPEHIVIDVTNLGLGQEFRVSDVKAGEGITVKSPADEIVVLVAAPKTEEEPSETEETAEPEVIKKGKEDSEK